MLQVVRRILSSRQAVRASCRDLFFRGAEVEPQVALDAAVDWLCRAQDATQSGGVAYGYDLRNGWLPAYPETTGYIIVTLLRYARECRERLGAEKVAMLRHRAERMAEWLSGLQMPCGAIPGGTVTATPVPTVFNTGQVLQGWCQALREFRDEKIRECLIRAARWLVAVQDEDGCWRRYMSALTVQSPASYNVRSAAALWETGQLLDDAELRRAARKNCDWALGQQRENGWFANNCMSDVDFPLTHAIGYTLEGLLDAAVMLHDDRYLHAVERAFCPLRANMRPDGFLAGRLDSQWRPQVKWSCLTGNCQIATVWFRLARLSGRKDVAEAGQTLLALVRRGQRVDGGMNGNAGCRAGEVGGIKGSQPIWGGYEPFCYPNWAAKFYADALLEQSQTLA